MRLQQPAIWIVEHGIESRNLWLSNSAHKGPLCSQAVFPLTGQGVFTEFDNMSHYLPSRRGSQEPLPDLEVAGIQRLWVVT